MYQNKITKTIFVISLLVHHCPSSVAFDPSQWSWQIGLGAGATVVSVALLSLLSKNYITPPLKYPKQYSIHLMWINRSLNLEQAYVYPATAESSHGKKYADTLVQWVKGNPEGTINLWFDGALVSNEAIKATDEQLRCEITKQGLLASSVKLNNIRDCEQAKKTPEVFSSEIPIYWRADFARAVVMKEQLEQNNDACCVYADFDIEPMAKKELFDGKSLDHLKKRKFVMAHEFNTLQFENGFQMFVHEETLLKAMQDMLIDANLIRARSFLEEMQEKKEPTSIFRHPHVWKRHEVAFQENVFYTYPLMYAYLGQLRGLCTLTFSGKLEHYDPKDKNEVLDLDAQLLMGRSSAIDYISRFPMPTKKVSFPVSTSKQQELTKQSEFTQ